MTPASPSPSRADGEGVVEVVRREVGSVEEATRALPREAGRGRSWPAANQPSLRPISTWPPTSVHGLPMASPRQRQFTEPPQVRAKASAGSCTIAITSCEPATRALSPVALR